MARVCDTSCGEGADEAAAALALVGEEGDWVEGGSPADDGDGGVSTARSAAISVCCSLSSVACESRSACSRCANAAPAGDMMDDEAEAEAEADADADADAEADADAGDAAAACLSEAVVPAVERVADGEDDGFICVETERKEDRSCQTRRNVSHGVQTV